jgi:hypothetical protein
MRRHSIFCFFFFLVTIVLSPMVRAARHQSACVQADVGPKGDKWPTKYSPMFFVCFGKCHSSLRLPQISRIPSPSGQIGERCQIVRAWRWMMLSRPQSAQAGCPSFCVGRIRRSGGGFGNPPRAYCCVLILEPLPNIITQTINGPNNCCLPQRNAQYVGLWIK